MNVVFFRVLLEVIVVLRSPGLLIELTVFSDDLLSPSFLGVDLIPPACLAIVQDGKGTTSRREIVTLTRETLTRHLYIGSACPCLFPQPWYIFSNIHRGLVMSMFSIGLESRMRV
jgi:hypothetical protein